MLASILKMPQAFGIPTDRVATITTEADQSVSFTGPLFHLQNDRLPRLSTIVGSCIAYAPQDLYKAVYIPPFSSIVIETVFATNQPNPICLYAKIISSQSVIYAISTKAIDTYVKTHYGVSLVPLSHFVFNSGQKSLINNQDFQIISQIVPPIFGHQSLSNFLNRLTDIKLELDLPSTQLALPTIGHIYHPLWQETPSVFNALITGQFDRSPFFDVPKPHPQIYFEQPHWFLYEKMNLVHKTGTSKIWVNHSYFDGVALYAFCMPETGFEMQISLHSAINGIEAGTITKSYDHPYQCLWMNLEGRSQYSYRDKFLDSIVDIAYQAVRAFCQAHHFELDTLSSAEHYRSTLTIAKTNTDEVAFIFYDSVHDVRMIYYTSAPALMLATQSVAWV